MQTASPKNIIQLFTISLVSSIVFAFLEIKALWTPDQIWNKLLTPLGVAAIVVYILFAIAGITVLFLSLWNPTPLRAFAQKMKKLRWLVAFVAIGFVDSIHRRRGSRSTVGLVLHPRTGSALRLE